MGNLIGFPKHTLLCTSNQKDPLGECDCKEEETVGIMFVTEEKILCDMGILKNERLHYDPASKRALACRLSEDVENENPGKEREKSASSDGDREEHQRPEDETRTHQYERSPCHQQDLPHLPEPPDEQDLMKSCSDILDNEDLEPETENGKECETRTDNESTYQHEESLGHQQNQTRLPEPPDERDQRGSCDDDDESEPLIVNLLERDKGHDPEGCHPTLPVEDTRAGE